MPLTDYTTYDEIRAALGVSDEEISNDTLALPMYAASLAIELRTIDPTLAEDYATIKAKDPGSRTDNETDVFNAVSVFAPYAVALQLASSLPLFAPKGVSDGKATLTRFSDSPYKGVVERCMAEYERWKTYLADAYATLNGDGADEATLPVLFTISSPSTNPITG